VWKSPEDTSFHIQIRAIIKLGESALVCKLWFVTTNKILHANEHISPNGFSSRNTSSRLDAHVGSHTTTHRRCESHFLLKKNMLLIFCSISTWTRLICSIIHFVPSLFCVDLLWNPGCFSLSPRSLTVSTSCLCWCVVTQISPLRPQRPRSQVLNQIGGDRRLSVSPGPPSSSSSNSSSSLGPPPITPRSKLSFSLHAVSSMSNPTSFSLRHTHTHTHTLHAT